MISDTTEQSGLLAAIAAWRTRHGLSETRAGVILARDHKFIGRLRAGRVTYRRGNQARLAMDAYDRATPAAAE